jgi:exodeoxyribonuclease V beta subunit
VTESFEALEFDLAGPLPTGISVLEASAGTGKTYTIAALAARYVAQGTPLERLLLVTFTRMATGELRERVRDRLVCVREGLDHVLAGVAPPEPDPIVDLFAAEPAELVLVRRDRLARAIADFDAATIATTHGFCQEVLVGLGIAADLEPDITFVEDLRELAKDVIDDLYVRRFHRADGITLPFAQAVEIARVAIENPAAEIVSAGGEGPQMRGRLATAARDELERRKRRMAVMTYDDLLSRLDAALAGRDGPTTASRLRARYDVVLVDEFQDTDPVQWDIMRLAFGAPDRALILIADPKQAIYAFRGADVYSYLEAAREASSRATLRVNWRSDQGLIDAYDALFAGAKLGHEGIAYRRVKAAPANRQPRLLGAPAGAPLRFRVVDRGSVEQTRYGYATKSSARAHIARDVAAEIVELLLSGAELETRSEGGTPIRRERVRPGHIAVLVPTNRHAAQVREALAAAGVPAVINGAGSVFGTEPAREWLRLLEAIERPAAGTRAHSAALTCFIGWNAERVAAADERAWEDVHQRLHDWARVMRWGGVASLIELITALEGLPRRILAEVDGERWLTDLRHVGQLLHAQAVSDQLGSTALAGWLRRRIAECKDDTGDEERSRRLESDAEAVQVLTVHRSKGLEFPIVHLPFMWEPGYIPEGERPVFFHDPDAGDRRTIDVSLEGGDYARHRTQYVLEQRGEDLRLAYVALTRARHQAVVWWAGSYDSRHSSLGRLLFARDEDGTIAAAGRFVPDDAAVYTRLRGLAERAPGCVAVEAATLDAPSAWRDGLAELAPLDAATFDRDLDLRWRRTSYTDITSGAHEPRVGSEPEEPLLADEGAFGAGENSLARILGPGQARSREGGAGPLGRDPLAQLSPLAEMPFGVQVGTFVHSVLEATDFAAPDLHDELQRQIALVQGGRATDLGDPEVVGAGLRATLETPLGPILDGARLRDFARGDRLDELIFELPLAGGDQPSGWLRLARLGQVLREHLGVEDQLAGYPDRLEDPALRQRVRGFLTGSLDLVVRMPGPDGPRFAVCDYKTNWLGLPDEPLTVWHYRPDALAAEMQRHHYGLQALLYAVALHRYLRWRLPDYVPERHIAGVLYLFVRGMVGGDTPLVDGAPCGVFGWRPPPGLVAALSDALDEGAP